MKGLGLKLLKIHLLFLAFLPLFIDKTPNPNPEVKQGRTLFWFKCAPPFNLGSNKIWNKSGGNGIIHPHQNLFKVLKSIIIYL